MSYLIKWPTLFLYKLYNKVLLLRRSAMYQLMSLTSIINTTKLQIQSTFVAFIDSSEAYNSIDRNTLFQKLQNLGLNDNILNAITYLY